MMGDELLPKRRPDKNQRLVVISDKDIYHVSYRNQDSNWLIPTSKYANIALYHRALKEEECFDY